jgi:hypothetical protein
MTRVGLFVDNVASPVWFRWIAKATPIPASVIMYGYVSNANVPIESETVVIPYRSRNSEKPPDPTAATPAASPAVKVSLGNSSSSTLEAKALQTGV